MRIANRRCGTFAMDQPKTVMERAERIFRLYVLPAITNVFIYTVAAFWSIGVIFKLIRRYHKEPSKIFYYKKRPLPPKVLNDPDFGNHCYIQLPNIKLHYVESGDKGKPLMILLHGFPEFWYTWRHQIKELSKDYWVVAVDMRGYGDSEKPPSIKFYKMKYLVEDVRNLIQGLGQEKAILVAHDWGGIVAWHVTKSYPEVVNKLIVLNAPYPAAFSRLLLSSFAQFLKSWYMFFFQLPFLPELQLLANDISSFKLFFRSKKHALLNDDDMECYKFTYGKPGAFYGPIAYYRANLMAFSRKSKKNDASKIVDYPKALMVFGDDDIAFDNKVIELSKTMYSNLVVELIPGACHFVHQDEPTIVNAKIKEFLASS